MKAKTNFLILCSLIVFSCSNTDNETKSSRQMKMELMVLSDYGSEEKIISDSTNVNQIRETINSLDWNDFHQVILLTDNNNWLEVGGSLSEDGLSAMYEENGEQFVINTPPKSVDHMTEILISYFNGDGKFKMENKFE